MKKPATGAKPAQKTENPSAPLTMPPARVTAPPAKTDSSQPDGAEVVATKDHLKQLSDRAQALAHQLAQLSRSSEPTSAKATVREVCDVALGFYKVAAELREWVDRVTESPNAE